MKEPFSFEPGRVVQSIQGRDKGKYFLILEELGQGMEVINLGVMKNVLELENAI